MDRTIPTKIPELTLFDVGTACMIAARTILVAVAAFAAGFFSAIARG
jgi:hypothetical protein